MKKLSILLVSAVLLFTSCEDFLTKYPSDSVTADQAIQTLQDAEVALNGVYSGFKSANYYGRYFVAHSDVMTDELQSVIGYSNQLGEMYKWSFTSNSGDVTGAWDIMYKVIVRASNVIDALPNIEDAEQADLDRIEGEARLARALAHFDLVKAFAKAYTQSNPSSDLGVPIIEHFELGQPERDVIADVYNFIRTEAQTAEGLLTDDGSTSSVFLTKAAASALLARISLYMGEWADAVQYATDVIDYPQFELETDSAGLANMFLNDEGSEVIFRIGLTKADYNGLYIGYNYYNNSQGDPSVDYIPADWIIDLFDANDLRWDATFKVATTKYGWAWPLVWKYPGNPDFYDSDLTTNANMYKVFRLSEMYLIRAEASAELDDETIARSDFNTLRTARIAGYEKDTLITGQDLKDAIWEERIRELCFEGHYLWDLKRTGRGFTRVLIDHPFAGVITNPGENQGELSMLPTNIRWQWPIPDDELKANSNITPNPGY